MKAAARDDEKQNDDVNSLDIWTRCVSRHVGSTHIVQTCAFATQLTMLLGAGGFGNLGADPGDGNPPYSSEKAHAEQPMPSAFSTPPWAIWLT